MQGFTEHLNEKKMCGEEDDKNLPFTPDAKKVKPSTAGKYGSAYSTVRNLARQAMQKQAKKKVEEKITVDEEVELQEASDSHKVMVTISDPQHTMVSQRKEQIMKHVIVRAGDKGEAQAKAEAFYKKKGYKVHGSEYHSKQPATSMKTEETNLEEALDKKKELKDALVRHEQHAIDANKRGDDEAVKVHQGYINKIKTKLGKMVQNEEVELDEKNTGGLSPGWMLKADPELKKKVDANKAMHKLMKKYAGKDLPKKEEYDMKTFSQFMEEIEEIEEAKKDDYWDFKDLKDEPKSTVRKIAGKAYGGAAQKDDEDEEHPVANKATEKRGRGRPKGSTSGARTGGAAKKSYGGLTFHSLSLPNSNK